VTGVGSLGVVTALKHCAVQLFNRYTTRNKHAALTVCQERRDRQPLLMCVDLKDFVSEQTGLLLEVPDRAVD